MMLESTQGLGNDRVGATREIDNGAEVILQFRVLRLPRVGTRVNAHGITHAGQIPPGKVKKMNRFLKYPVADTLDVVAPAFGPSTIRVAPQLDQDVERLSDG